MSRRSFTSKLPAEDEVLELVEHGYVLRNKLAIGFWLFASAFLLVTVFIGFVLQTKGIDWSWWFGTRLIPTYGGSDIAKWGDSISVISIVEVAGTLLGVYAWIKAMIAFFPTATLRTQVRMGITPLSPKTKA